MEGRMTSIKIDGKIVEVDPEKNLLEACLAVGLYIPHFCFHPALGSVGACRLCAVKKYKNEEDKRGKITMSCMETVTDGMIISIDDPEVKVFRAMIIESLMTNHPHDCPVCDEGGECHLQDMTVMSGHNYRQFDFAKRTYYNQNLGPFINHEMNRCIQCYRCVRFYCDYAGGNDLQVLASHNHVYFGRHKDGTLENEFSGNLVEVCPTGVFTDKPLSRHFTRKWDLTNAPSVCVHCSVGCNTIISERYGTARRIMSRYNGAVNGYFICDRGRFGYEFVNGENRVLKAMAVQEKDGTQGEVSLSSLEISLKETFTKNTTIIGIGSPRASVESNYALARFVGESNFYHGVSGNEYQLTKSLVRFLQNSKVISPSLKEMELADAVLVLGEDITNTAPMMALSLRQAVRNKSKKEAIKFGIPLWNDAPVRNLAQDDRDPLFIATPMNDRLDEIANAIFRGSYDDIACLGFEIAKKIDPGAPASDGRLTDQQALIDKIADALKNAAHPLIITGVNSGQEQVLHAAINVATALSANHPGVMFSTVFPECNSMGMEMMYGKPLDEALKRISADENATVIILENDLYRRAAKKEVDQLFSGNRLVIAIDHLMNRTSKQAGIILPAATFAESDGILINNEGRAQRYFKAMLPKGDVKESWRWIGELIKIRQNNTAGVWDGYNDLVSEMKKNWVQFSMLNDTMHRPTLINEKIPRQTPRYSGRTAMFAHLAVSETKPDTDNDSPLAFSMEGQAEHPPSSMVPFYWTPGWNSVQSMNHYLDAPNGSLKGGNPGIRLFSPVPGSEISYFPFMVPTTNEVSAEWKIIPVYSIFGSEELSALSPAISERIKEPFIYLNQDDLKLLDLNENDLARVETINGTLELKCKSHSGLKQGLAGMDVYHPGMTFLDFPVKVKILKAVQ